MNSKVINFLFENSLFLIIGTILALFGANLFFEQYHHIVHTEIFRHVNLHFVINDVLMCFFFAMAAKEIWESLLPGGALSSPKKAATPLLATLGGIMGPAGLYVAGALWFGATELVRGWAVPCATDIAFSYLVARIIFGKGHPAIPFLLLLAIADDAAGLIILAVAYPTGTMNLQAFLLLVCAAVSFNVVLREIGVKNFWAYLVVAGPLSWAGFFLGGIHPALALVPIIPTIPHSKSDHGYFEGTEDEHPHDALNEFEHWWKRPVEVILMLFGFANAGVAFSSVGLATGLVSVGLLIGKPVGIFLFTMIGLCIFKLSLPDGMNKKDLLVLGCVAGIGFTVALFVSTVAFPSGEILDSAKMGALFSFSAAIVAFCVSKIIGIKKLGVDSE